MLPKKSTWVLLCPLLLLLADCGCVPACILLNKKNFHFNEMHISFSIDFSKRATFLSTLHPQLLSINQFFKIFLKSAQNLLTLSSDGATKPQNNKLAIDNCGYELIYSSLYIF